MPDVSTLTHDELAVLLGSCVRELEKRLEAEGRTPALRRVARAHGILTAVGTEAVDSGDIVALSIGDK